MGACYTEIHAKRLAQVVLANEEDGRCGKAEVNLGSELKLPEPAQAMH